MVIRSTSKRIFSIRYYASFLPFMTIIKHGFQSLILRNVKFKSPLNFLIFKGALVIKDYVRFAFLFVQTVFKNLVYKARSRMANNSFIK